MDAMLNWLWQGGAVAAAAFVMLHALERARANVRYVVCWAAALVVIALPVVPSLQPAELPAAGFPAAPGDALVSLPDAWWTSAVVILAAWVAWVSAHVFSLVSAIAAIRRARARSRAFPPHVAAALPHWRRISAEGRRATLVLSDAVPAAAVLGWGTPMIAVAPSLVTTLDADELDRVLVHEWAHVQRRDDLVNLAQILVRAIAGWHPALWWIDRRLTVEREIACDEIAVALTGSPKSYAECLVKLAGVKGAPRAMKMAPAVLASSGLRARVIKIVSPYPSIAAARSRSIAAAIVTLLCLLCAGLGGLEPVRAAELALPLVSSARLFGHTLHQVAPAAVPAAPPAAITDSPARRASSEAPSPQRPSPEPPSPVTPPVTGSQPGAALTVPSLEPTPGTDAAAVPGHAIETQLPGAPAAQPKPSSVTAGTSQSPWDAAAAGGVAIGRKSKQAGVATAGFFTRFARKVAGSF
jgi:beta-lactamase regulating signal transducer with metallopeptidase domain